MSRSIFVVFCISCILLMWNWYVNGWWAPSAPPAYSISILYQKNTKNIKIQQKSNDSHKNTTKIKWLTTFAEVWKTWDWFEDLEPPEVGGWPLVHPGEGLSRPRLIEPLWSSPWGYPRGTLGSLWGNTSRTWAQGPGLSIVYCYYYDYAYYYCCYSIEREIRQLL